MEEPTLENYEIYIKMFQKRQEQNFNILFD